MGAFKYIFPLLLLFEIKIIHADTDTLNFDGYCSYSVNTIYDDDTYIVEWTGSSVDTTPCIISFEADGFGDYDEYQVCVDTEQYFIDAEDCNVELTYSQGVDSVEVQRYGCGDFPSSWCSNDNFADIKLYGSTERASSSQSNFRLKVTSVGKDSDVSVTMYIYVAVGVAVFLIVISLCIMVIRVARLKNLQRRAAQLNVNPSQSYQSINTSGTFHPPYGVESPSSIHNYPPAYGYQGYLKSSRATPPPPYSVPTGTSPSTSGGSNSNGQ